ncbi:MAG: M3 family oligoendopeptidase [bacterium]|nr:M3 family oligoendopeptidase [bacterium]
MKITKPKRTFVASDLVIDAWEKIEKYYTNLLERDISEKSEFEAWLKDISELEAILEEDMAWRYIKMTINTKDETLSKDYTFFVTEIQPKLAPLEDQLNRKLTASPFTEDLKSDPAYAILFRSIENALNLYREENIPIQAELAEESQKFGALSAAQSIEHEGENITMQKAALYLKETDEAIRKDVFEKMGARRREDFDKFDALFDSLLKKRHQVALNAGFENFRDYKLQAMGRFDYSVQDCRDFHQSVKSTIVPIVRQIQQERLSKLGKDKFKPWDLDVDPEGKLPLKPFKTGAELLSGSIAMFNRVDPYFGDCLATMSEMGHLDLESKDGKSPGGYNYPLYEIGVPFIFMNAVGSHRDLVTMVHEGGHAVHSFLSRELEITGFKSLPSEVAELASMSMELLTMDQWQEFYSNEDDLNRAKKEQLETILRLLPWIAQVDEFQHWLYENHQHSAEERHSYWVELSKQYGTGLTDWSGYQDLQRTSWQRQLHIFEVPFYYIEYGIAQLGALGVWKNSLEDKPKAIQQYKNALKLGYTRSIPEIYAEAGVKFDFTEANITSLASFVQSELDALK